MTTIHKSQQSPRLPINHPEHVARILERAERVQSDRRGDRIMGILIVTCIAVITLCLVYPFL